MRKVINVDQPFKPLKLAAETSEILPKTAYELAANASRTRWHALKILAEHVSKHVGKTWTRRESTKVKEIIEKTLNLERVHVFVSEAHGWLELNYDTDIPNYLHYAKYEYSVFDKTWQWSVETYHCHYIGPKFRPFGSTSLAPVTADQAQEVANAADNQRKSYESTFAEWENYDAVTAKQKRRNEIIEQCINDLDALNNS